MREYNPMVNVYAEFFAGFYPNPTMVGGYEISRLTQKLNRFVKRFGYAGLNDPALRGVLRQHHYGDDQIDAAIRNVEDGLKLKSRSMCNSEMSEHEDMKDAVQYSWIATNGYTPKYKKSTVDELMERDMKLSESKLFDMGLEESPRRASEAIDRHLGAGVNEAIDASIETRHPTMIIECDNIYEYIKNNLIEKGTILYSKNNEKVYIWDGIDVKEILSGIRASTVHTVMERLGVGIQNTAPLISERRPLTRRIIKDGNNGANLRKMKYGKGEEKAKDGWRAVVNWLIGLIVFVSGYAGVMALIKWIHTK